MKARLVRESILKGPSKEDLLEKFETWKFGKLIANRNDTSDQNVKNLINNFIKEKIENDPTYFDVHPLV